MAQTQTQRITQEQVVQPQTVDYVPLTRFNTVINNYITPAISTLSRVVYSIPQNLYSTTLDVTNTIAGKMQELGDAYTGKGSKSVNDNEFVQISKKHFDFLERLRKTNNKKYKEFELLSDFFNNASPEKQTLIVQTYFNINKTNN